MPGLRVRSFHFVTCVLGRDGLIVELLKAFAAGFILS
jgi:hypothetical protein